MNLNHPLSHGLFIVGCLVMALVAGDAIAQMAPYGAPPVYAAGNQQGPGAYSAYSYPATHGVATYGVQPNAHVARMNPETLQLPSAAADIAAPVIPPAPVANNVKPDAAPFAAPFAAPYAASGASYAIPGQTLNNNGCNGCTTNGSSCAIGAGGNSHIGGLLRPYGHGANCGCGQSAGCRHWFGGIYGLYMTHDDENARWMSWDGADVSSQLLDSREASPGWQTGNELRFGSTFASLNAAWEVVFWGLYGEQGQQVATTADVTGALNTTFDFSGLEYDNGSGTVGPVNDWFDDAQMHRVLRHFEVQNVEINLFHFPLAGCVGPCGATSDTSCGGAAGYVGAGYGGGYSSGYNNGGLYGRGDGRGASACCSPPRFSIVGMAGIRYMRLDEWIDFDTDATDTAFGSSEDELFYDIETENHLIGFQLGCAVNYRVTDRLALTMDGKGGIYGNHIQHTSLIWGQGGFAYVAAGQPYAGQNFDVKSTKDDVSFLGELRLGLTYRIGCHWQLYSGYRAIGISGVALPTNQIPQYFADTVGVGVVDSNGSMILHGAQFGVEAVY